MIRQRESVSEWAKAVSIENASQNFYVCVQGVSCISSFVFFVNIIKDKYDMKNEKWRITEAKKKTCF